MHIQEHVVLTPYTTLSVGGPARYFVVVKTVEELASAVLFARQKTLPIFILGSGANIVISDRGFDGLVVKVNIQDILFTDENKDVVRVTAGAGVVWDDLVRECVQRDLRGLESTSGIPGTVGAAVVGNIAAYGQAVSDSIDCVEVIDSDTVESGIEKIDKSQLGLRYRYSDFQNEKLSSKIIISATFLLDRRSKPKLEYKSALRIADELGLDYENNIDDHRAAILEARRRAGSLLEEEEGVVAKTAGSFFRNPEVPIEVAEKILGYEEFGVSKSGILKQNKVHGGDAARVSAAHVLLAAGFKRGQQWGDVRLHPKHILKIENVGGATAQDIYDVSKKIVATVKEKLKIDLVPEVRFIGDFK